MSVPKNWAAAHIVSQKAKTAIVTGANSGIGFVTALELARHGANVVLACRNEIKGRDAVAKIQQELQLSPQAGSVAFQQLDVSSLASVASFSQAFTKSHDRLDLLINNAGTMSPSYRETVDGLESMFATNYLGHFALTAQLLSLLRKSPRARVVTVSSREHRAAKMDLQAIMTPQAKFDCYAVSRNTKLYGLLFTYELNRRLQAHAVTNVMAVASHPGMTSSNIAEATIQESNALLGAMIKVAMKLPIFQSPEMGALPSLYAATAPDVQPNDYFGPESWNNGKGHPVKEEPRNVAESEEHAKRLWEASERLAKLRFTW